MTREETIAAIQVMQAYVDGAEIEVKPKDCETWGSTSPRWNWVFFDYRVKPKPKLELRVGAWYELQSGQVMQCFRILPEFIEDTRGWSASKESITREVRVLPVEE